LAAASFASSTSEASNPAQAARLHANEGRKVRRVLCSSVQASSHQLFPKPPHFNRYSYARSTTDAHHIGYCRSFERLTRHRFKNNEINPWGSTPRDRITNALQNARANIQHPG